LHFFLIEVVILVFSILLSIRLCLDNNFVFYIGELNKMWHVLATWRRNFQSTRKSWKVAHDNMFEAENWYYV